jgi:hypothetical protein
MLCGKGLIYIKNLLKYIAAVITITIIKRKLFITFININGIILLITVLNVRVFLRVVMRDCFFFNIVTSVIFKLFNIFFNF